MGGSYKNTDVINVATGIDLMRMFIMNFDDNGYAQAFLMEREDLSLYVRENIHQPCQGGEMRTYAESNGNVEEDKGDPLCTRPGDPRPGDLYCPFPDGTPLAVAIPFRYAANHFMNAMFDDVVFNSLHSPWRSLLHGVPEELTVNNAGKINGVIFNNTDVDSTVLVSLCRYINSEAGGHSRVYNELVKLYPDGDRLLLFIAANFFNNLEGKSIGVRDHNNTYTALNGAPDFKRVYEGNPVDLTGGTFKNRFAYNRPQIDFLFGKNVNPLYQILKDKLYPKVRYPEFKSYDLDVMLNVLGGLCKGVV